MESIIRRKADKEASFALEVPVVQALSAAMLS